MGSHDLKIAIINPFRPDGLARTIFDGILSLNSEGSAIDFRLSSKFDYSLPLENKFLSKNEFIEFAKTADLVFVLWGKDGTDFTLAGEINCWNKTIYLDGSEVGKNRRYDLVIQEKILDGTYFGNGSIDRDMVEKCALYFRREKPYLSGIAPLPFGIESKYTKHCSPSITKDIDFVCVFGQEEYPVMRREVRELVEQYCAQSGFVCHTKKTKTPEEFYKILARAKVGVSVGGGGFDTFRFWEILANNCFLLTEKIDIYADGSHRLQYKRIVEFKETDQFYVELQRMGQFLKSSYDPQSIHDEYEKILSDHSSKSRVLEVIEKAREKGIIE